MTAFTASVSGLASASATWGGAAGPAANGDTMTINSGVVVDWDKDLTGLTTGLGACVINGTLQAHRAAGSYGVKRNGIWSGTGLIDASDGAGGAYAGGQTFKLVDNAAFGHTMSGVMNILCLEPVHKWVRLTQAANLGDTVLHIDTDLTGEPTYWVAADLVNVDDINNNASSELAHAIASKSSTTLTLSVALTASKLVGAYVNLVSRNVKINGIGAGSGTAFSAPGLRSIINAEIRSFGTAVQSTGNGSIGGAISNCNTQISSCRNMSITALLDNGNPMVAASSNNLIFQASALISAAAQGLEGTGHTVFCDIVGSGVSSLNGSGIWFINNHFIGCQRAANTAIGDLIFSNVSFNGMLRVLDTIPLHVTFYNCLFTSVGTFFFGSDSSARALWAMVESFDHNQVAGAYMNWCRGGNTTLITSGTIYPGRAQSYQHTLANDADGSAAYSFRDQQVLVPANGWVNVTAYMQIDTSMSNPPQLQIFPASTEPLASGSPTASATMANTTGSWQILTAKAQNTGTTPRLFKVRVIGQNASGNVFEDCDISTSPFGWALGEAQ